MESWQPLAPTKRTSGMYARANAAAPPALQAMLPTATAHSPASSSSKLAAPATAEERRAAILQRPSDPFPPVGPLPRAVAVRILSYLTLGEQRTCALAGRALARAVADESNWSRRLYALDWCRVDGLKVPDDTQKDERDIGRRRKGKQKESVQHTVDLTVKAAVIPNADPAARKALGHPSPHDVRDTTASSVDDEDEFGDFSGPSANKDAFADFNFDKVTSGGSFASGTASVAMGGGRPHAFSWTGAPSYTPLSPTKASNGGQAISGKESGPSRGTVPITPSSTNGSLFSYAVEASLPLCSASPSFLRIRSYAKALRPFLKSLADTTALATTSLLFTCDLGLAAQTALLSNMLRFLSTSVGGGPPKKHSDRSNPLDNFGDEGDESSVSARGQDAAHHLLDNLLSSFQGTLARRSDAVRASSHGADTTRAIRRAEDDMRALASGVWELGNARLALAVSERGEITGGIEDYYGRRKAAKIFLEACDILTSALKHDPLENVSLSSGTAVLDFTPMDRFIAELIEVVKTDGEIIARVFPPEQDVLLAYGDRVAQDVIARYIRPLLNHARTISMHMYLRSCAATFEQSRKLVQVLLSIEPRDTEIVTEKRCEEVVFNMWEEHIDGYLQVEQEWVRHEMQAVTEKWESDVRSESASRVDAAFLGSHNPAAVKRSVLSGFKDVLLLPVTVVPRTAGIVGGAVIRTAGTGLSTLNPMRWQSGGATSGQQQKAGVASSDSTGRLGISGGSAPNGSLPSPARTPNEASEKGYMDFSSGAVGTMDSDDDEDDADASDGVLDDMNEQNEWSEEVAAWSAVASSRPSTTTAAIKSEKKANRRSARASVLSSAPSSLATPSTRASTIASNASRDTSRSSTPQPKASPASLTQMQLLLSLDTALQVIHVNRDCLKRIETFKDYPTPYGGKVRDAMQDVSLLLFRALGDGHIAPGFEKATKQITEWKPEEHAAGTAARPHDDDQEKSTTDRQEVEPLVHFFELVHVGDTIAQMVLVYFEQEMARHIDKNDFLNPVVKGRKRFEAHLDEAVARGLNAGVDLLLGQADHIISTRQSPKDYWPSQGQLNDLSPTIACTEAVDCLQMHCRMLIGTTDKTVLEVFHQEVGIRLHAIICKHLKKQTISLDGGFRVIADLNKYHTFIATLRQPSLTADFDALKMLGNLYIIDNPKELAKLARDASIFGGTLSPEDLYEFLQARADFRSIEKAIDKEMYGFKVSEDCCVC